MKQPLYARSKVYSALKCFLIIPIVAAITGGIVPLSKALIALLIRNGIGAEFFQNNPIGRYIPKMVGIDSTVQGPESLFKELALASEKMDTIVKRVREYTKGREESVVKLEMQLGLLTKQEQDLKERIESLREVPLPAAEYFAQVVRTGERRSAWRDYALFLLGVLVSTGIAVLLRKLGWA